MLLKRGVKIAVSLVVLFFLVVAGSMLLFGKGGIQGFIIGETLQEETIFLNTTFVESQEQRLLILRHPDFFSLKSLQITGHVQGNDTARVYAVVQNETYLLYEYDPAEGFNLITGNVAGAKKNSLENETKEEKDKEEKDKEDKDEKKAEKQPEENGESDEETLPANETDLYASHEASSGTGLGLGSQDDPEEATPLTSEETVSNISISSHVTDEISQDQNATLNVQNPGLDNTTEQLNGTVVNNSTGLIHAPAETNQSAETEPQIPEESSVNENNLSQPVDVSPDISLNITPEEIIPVSELLSGEIFGFIGECQETCSLDVLNATSFIIRIELDPGTYLHIDEIKYSLIEVLPHQSIEFIPKQDPTESVTLSAVLNNGSLVVQIINLGNGTLPYKLISKNKEFRDELEGFGNIVHTIENYSDQFVMVKIGEDVYTLGTPARVTLAPRVKDANGKTLKADILVKNNFDNRTLITKKHKVLDLQATATPQLEEGLYDLELAFAEGPVHEIVVTEASVFDQEASVFEVDDVPETEGWEQMYALNPTMNFTIAEVTVTAVGSELYKCAAWDFAARNCTGEWISFKTGLIPGQNYTFNMTSDDPGFAEGSASRDVAVAPLGNTSFVVAWIDDTQNNLTFRIMNTTGVVIVERVVVDAVVDSTSAVSVTPINATQFVITWIDGPDDDATMAIYSSTGTQILGATDVDTNVGTTADIDAAGLDTNYVVCYANENDGDADFKIYNNAGTQTVGETAADTNMDPSAANQNLVSCAGINQTHWTYFWFDDNSNDATYRIVRETGSFVIGETDLDTDVGETGQVATAATSDAIFFVWYDSTDDDITIAIRSAQNAVVLAPTDIDTNAGTSSRVAATVVLNGSQQLFVPVWIDQAGSTISAAVYSATGTQLTAPFVVDTQESATLPLLAVAGLSPITSLSLCPGKFIVAYTNATNNAMFVGYDVNGTVWGGKCGQDIIPPNVTQLFPENKTLYPINAEVPISARVVDDELVSSVDANLTLPSGSSVVINLTFNPVSGRYESVFSSTSQLGMYWFTIRARDNSGNLNASESSTFIIAQANMTFAKFDIPDPVIANSTINYTINYSVALTEGVPPFTFTHFKFIFNNLAEEDSPQMIESVDGTLIVTYSSNASGNNDIYVVRSENRGDTWSSPIQLTTSGFDDDVPNIFEDNSDVIHVVYSHMEPVGFGDVFVVSSSDDGLTWTAPHQITATAVQSEYEPVIDQNSADTYFLAYGTNSSDPDVEVFLHYASSVTGTWSEPIQMTNNTYNDHDIEILITDEDQYLFAWSPEFPDFQEIWFANISDPLVPFSLDAAMVAVTDNDFYDYETSIHQDTEGSIYIGYVALLDTAQAALPNRLRTTNELFIAKSTDGGSTFTLLQITNNTISDSYPGIIQSGVNGFFYISALRVNGTDLDPVISRRDASAQDAFNVTIMDEVPPNVIVTQVNQGGNLVGNKIIWNVSLLYAGENGFVSFQVRVNETLVNGTILTNFANLTYHDENNTSFFQNASQQTTVIALPPPQVIGFSLTLPGQAPVFANVTLPSTANMFFNATATTQSNVQPCVQATAFCQNTTLPFFEYKNTGSVNLNLSIYLTQNFPLMFTLKSALTANPFLATDVNTTPKTLATNLLPNATLNTFFWGDFINALPVDATNRTLRSDGNQTA